MVIGSFVSSPVHPSRTSNSDRLSICPIHLDLDFGLSLSQLVSGRNSTNPAIWLVPEVGRIRQLAVIVNLLPFCPLFPLLPFLHFHRRLMNTSLSLFTFRRQASSESLFGCLYLGVVLIWRNPVRLSLYSCEKKLTQFQSSYPLWSLLSLRECPRYLLLNLRWSLFRVFRGDWEKVARNFTPSKTQMQHLLPSTKFTIFIHLTETSSK